MKRLPAILFLLILVFNFYGYRMVISYMEMQSQGSLENRVDKHDYNDAELVSIKTILHLPYYTSSAEYERAYGSINVNGVIYECVKKRVYHDTLELLCLPNQEKTKLKAMSNELTKLVADDQSSLPNKKSNTILKLNLPDFFQSLSDFQTLNMQVIRRNFISFNTSYPITDHSSLPEKPPQSVHNLS